MSLRIQSVLAPIKLSFDDGLTWKDLVCLTNYNAPLNNSTNDTETFCGKLVGQGNAALDFSGEAVCDLEPDSDMVSYNDLNSVILSKSVILGRVVYPGTGSVGSNLHLQTEIVVESTTLKGTANDYLKFDFSLKGQGVPQVVPA